jgi:hypothetical protein
MNATMMVGHWLNSEVPACSTPAVRVVYVGACVGCGRRVILPYDRKTGDALDTAELGPHLTRSQVSMNPAEHGYREGTGANACYACAKNDGAKYAALLRVLEARAGWRK